MASLTTDLKTEIVTRLASFEGAAEILKDLKARGVEISLQGIARYDPQTVAGDELAQKWKDLFYATRLRYNTEISDIPIANQGYRLRALERMATKAEGMRNYALAAQLHEQAAKERGGAYLGKVAAGVADLDVSGWTEIEFLERVGNGEDPYRVAADRARALAGTR